jgi:hypothetical protein
MVFSSFIIFLAFASQSISSEDFDQILTSTCSLPNLILGITREIPSVVTVVFVYFITAGHLPTLISLDNDKNGDHGVVPAGSRETLMTLSLVPRPS